MKIKLAHCLLLCVCLSWWLSVSAAPLAIPTPLSVASVAAFRASYRDIRKAIINDNGAADSYIITWPRSDGNLLLTLNSQLTTGGDLYLVGVTGTGANAFTWNVITEAGTMGTPNKRPNPISLLTYGPKQINWNPVFLSVAKAKNAFVKANGTPYLITDAKAPKKTMIDSLAELVEGLRLFAVEDRIVTDSIKGGGNTNFQSLRQPIHDWATTAKAERTAGNLNAAVTANKATVALPPVAEIKLCNAAYKTALKNRIDTQGAKTN